MYNCMCIIEKNIDKNVISRLKFHGSICVNLVSWNGALVCQKIGLSGYMHIDFFALAVEKYTNAYNNFILNCWFTLSTRFEKFLEKYQCGIHLSSQLLKCYENNERYLMNINLIILLLQLKNLNCKI